MKLVTFLEFVLLLLTGGFSAMSGVAQEVHPVVPQPTASVFHSSSNLALVDVIVLDAKRGVPDIVLKQEDFQVFDNGHPVSIATFDSGASTRPLALWFIVQCRMQGWDTKGSGLFAGQISLFRPALKYLDKKDTVAVAHWCDNGDSQLDLLPTSNLDEAVTALEQVLAPVQDANLSDITGERALQKTLQLIVDSTRSLVPEPIPVVVFLYGDWSGMPKSEADHYIDQLVQTATIAYGLKDRRSPHLWFWLPGEQKEIAHYIATQTGGEYLSVTAETYANGLEEILRQMHLRYQLGFKPQSLEGKRHKLRVKLADGVTDEHKGLHLRYRLSYTPTRHGAR